MTATKLDVNSELSPAWAFEEYERIRNRLPRQTSSVIHWQAVDSLQPLTEEFDVFVFDAFGVLNVGQAPIPEAVTRFRALQAAGKRCLILSNAATATPMELLGKYRRLGFELPLEDLICSRQLLHNVLAEQSQDLLWGVIAPPDALPEQLGVKYLSIHGTADDTLRAKLEQAEGLIFLSSQDWSLEHQHLLEETLIARPRLILIANPDLVAPRETGLSLEPGYYAHRLIDRVGLEPAFFGKPFSVAFDTALARLTNVPRERVLMVGDTLHTDILGGRCAGIRTLLVTAHGSLQGLDVAACMSSSGIYPDYVAPCI